MMHVPMASAFCPLYTGTVEIKSPRYNISRIHFVPCFFVGQDSALCDIWYGLNQATFFNWGCYTILSVNIATVSTCSWAGVSCDNCGVITSLQLVGGTTGGSLSPSLGALTSLIYLQIEGINVIGTIPGTVGALTQLNTLSFNNNALTGAFPYQLGQLTQLTLLELLTQAVLFLSPIQVLILLGQEEDSLTRT